MCVNGIVPPSSELQVEVYGGIVLAGLLDAQ